MMMSSDSVLTWLLSDDNPWIDGVKEMMESLNATDKDMSDVMAYVYITCLTPKYIQY